MISLIAVIGENRELGYKNKLLWDIPEDLEYFHKKTRGHTVVMGRRTFESIGRVLSGRKNIVMTKDKNWKCEGVCVAHDLTAARQMIDDKQSEVFVIGGAEVYDLWLDFADKLYLTLVDKYAEADRYFPEYKEKFREISRVDSEQKGLRFSFLELVRK